jgi:hypothetical protein
MDPTLKLILDTMNSRFDDLDRRFADRDATAATRTAAVDERFDLLTAHQAAATSAVANSAAALEQRLASLEASYVDRDTEYANRLSELESLRVAHLADDGENRMAALEKSMADLAAWRPDMEGVLDDVRLRVEKIDSKCDRVVFDNTPHSVGLLRSPAPASATTASASAVSGVDISLPKGPGVEPTTRDIASGFVTTWTHIPAMGKPLPTPPSYAPGFVFPPPPPPPPNLGAQHRFRPIPPTIFPGRRRCSTLGLHLHLLP